MTFILSTPDGKAALTTDGTIEPIGASELRKFEDPAVAYVNSYGHGVTLCVQSLDFVTAHEAISAIEGRRHG